MKRHGLLKRIFHILLVAKRSIFLQFSQSYSYLQFCCHFSFNDRLTHKPQMSWRKKKHLLLCLICCFGGMKPRWIVGASSFITAWRIYILQAISQSVMARSWIHWLGGSLGPCVFSCAAMKGVKGSCDCTSSCTVCHHTELKYLLI